MVELDLRSSARGTRLPPEIVANAVEWFSTRDVTYLKGNVAGTLAATGTDNSVVRYWKGRIRGTELKVGSDLETGCRYRTNRIGRRAALNYSGTGGMIGSLSYTAWTRGCSIILLGQFQGVAATWKKLASLCSDLVTDPWPALNGVSLGFGPTGAEIEFARNNTNLEHAGLSALTPYEMVAMLSQDIDQGAVNIPGVTTNASLYQLSVNGGLPFRQFGPEGSGLTLNYLSIGGATNSRSAPSLDVADAIFVDGAVLPGDLQALREQYIVPEFGPGVF